MSKSKRTDQPPMPRAAKEARNHASSHPRRTDPWNGTTSDPEIIAVLKSRRDGRYNK